MLIFGFFFPQINHVGPVPTSYYVRDHVSVEYDRCLTVNRGSSRQLDYEILFPGCVLRSDVQTTSVTQDAFADYVGMFSPNF